MGEAIRWDTMMSRPNSDAISGINSAAGLINNGFSQLNGVMQRSQDNEAANFANHTKLNTSAFLDAVSKYQNPDDLRTAMAQGGALDQLRASLGPNINHDAIRGAADARIKATMQQAQDNILYKHAMKDEETAGLVQQFQVARMKGDQAGMDAAMTAYSSKDGRDPTAMLKFADQRDWEINQRGMQLQTNNDQHLTSVSNIEHNRAMEGIGARQAAAAEQQAATQGKLATFQIDTGTEDRKNAKAAGMAAAAKSLLKENGNLAADGLYTGNQADELRLFMKANNFGGGDSNKQSNAIDYLNKLTQTGIPMVNQHGNAIIDPKTGKQMIMRDIPMAAVKAVVGGTDNAFWNIGWNTGPAKDMKANLEALLGTAIEYKDGTIKSKALDDLSQFTKVINNAAENAPGIAPNRAAPNPYKRK